MKKNYITRKARMELRSEFFRRLGPCAETMRLMFELVEGVNFNMIDDNDRIMAFNRNNCENCNIRSEDEAIGKSCHELFPKVLADIYTKRNREVRESGRPVVNRIYTHAADRSTDIKVVSIFPLRDLNGRIIGTTSMNRAIESRSAKPDWYGAIHTSVAYIDEHFAEKLSTDTLARISKMSASTFRRMFAKVMETTPGAYVNTIRINHARKLLSGNDKTIEAISVECGFYDQSHFEKAFKRERGMTPGEYRRRHRQA